ncbi:hypothetical protein [Ensifer canadensis]
MAARSGARSTSSEGDEIDERALQNLVRAAIDYNQAKAKKKASSGSRAKAAKSTDA